MEKYLCPEEKCSFIGSNWLNLMNHTKEVHNKFLWYRFIYFFFFNI